MVHLEGLYAAARVIEALNALDEAMGIEEDGYFVNGTLVLAGADGFEVGKIVYEDDFWVFKEAQ